MDNQTYIVKGMDCADCALKVEKGVRQLEGIQSVQIDFSTGLLHVQGPVAPQALQNRVKALGYQLEEKGQTGQTQVQANALVGFWQFLLGRAETRLALAGGALILLALALRLFGISEPITNLVLIAALGVAIFPIARSAVVNLWINHDFSINLLMMIAAVGAVIIGEYTESATLIFLFAIAEALEGYTADRARSVLGELSHLAPETAIRITPQGEEVVAVTALQPGDEVLVKAGERIPMDGIVSSGQSTVNQAPITGESLPVEKVSGEEVFAGTVNGSGALSIKITHPAGENTIQRIIRMIEQAQSLRAPTQRFIDRFAQIYTPAVVAVAALVALVPPLLFGQPFFNPAEGGLGWLYRALALLVIACPCALVISAPVTIVSAITAAARQGVLFKGGAYLEALAAVRAFAFDKTGTLTLGQPVVTDSLSADCLEDAGCDGDEVLALASALEKRSAHPLARSVLTAAEARGVVNIYPAADQVQTLAGSGLQGHVNGKLATIGNHKLFDQLHPHHEALCEQVQQAEAQGKTTMLVCDGERVRGFIAVADAVRAESRQIISSLKDLGKATAMLTGDNLLVASAVGQQTGVSDIQANLLPEDKVAAIQSLITRYGSVAMVGDGINDAPALAAATLGIAMGGAGSAQAMETADIVLMANDLQQLPFAVRLSGFARRLIRQNIAFSLTVKLVFVILAMTGLTSLWLAVLADMGVSLVVTLNGMRANHYR